MKKLILAATADFDSKAWLRFFERNRDFSLVAAGFSGVPEQLDFFIQSLQPSALAWEKDRDYRDFKDKLAKVRCYQSWAALLAEVDYDILVNCLDEKWGLTLSRLAQQNNKSLVLSQSAALAQLLTLTKEAKPDNITVLDPQLLALKSLLPERKSAEIKKIYLCYPPVESVEKQNLAAENADKAARDYPASPENVRIEVDKASGLYYCWQMLLIKALWAIDPTQVDLLAHPQRAISVLAEFVDGSVLASNSFSAKENVLAEGLGGKHALVDKVVTNQLTEPWSFMAEHPELSGLRALAEILLKEGEDLLAAACLANHLARQSYFLGKLPLRGILPLVYEVAVSFSGYLKETAALLAEVKAYIFRKLGD